MSGVLKTYQPRCIVPSLPEGSFTVNVNVFMMTSTAWAAYCCNEFSSLLVNLILVLVTDLQYLRFIKVLVFKQLVLFIVFIIQGAV